jgi:hypothetical protein
VRRKLRFRVWETRQFFIFQHDSAPAQPCSQEMTRPSRCWLARRPTSSHMHCRRTAQSVYPVDYEIWNHDLQDSVYRTRIRDVSHLKERLTEEWRDFDHSIIERAVTQWRFRLEACVQASGGHFEHYCNVDLLGRPLECRTMVFSILETGVFD